MIDAQNQWDEMLGAVAAQIPPAPIHQPENDLRPDPAKLFAYIRDLDDRTKAIERWIRKIDPTFSGPLEIALVQSAKIVQGFSDVNHG